MHMTISHRLLSYCIPGDILTGTVLKTDPESVWVDLDGTVAELPRKRIALSPICGTERFHPGMTIHGAVQRIDRAQKRIQLTHRELLGTFDELTNRLEPGLICRGIWCRAGCVELAPNLLASVRGGSGQTGGAARVRITRIDRLKCTLSASFVDDAPSETPSNFTYYITNGRIKHWSYGNCPENISTRETVFWR